MALFMRAAFLGVEIVASRGRREFRFSRKLPGVSKHLSFVAINEILLNTVIFSGDKEGQQLVEKTCAAILQE